MAGGEESRGIEQREVGTRYRRWPWTVLPLGATVVALLAFLPSVAAATVLPEKITEDTTLTVAGNPYSGTSTIEPGVTLTVDSGVELTDARITINGTIIADGTEEAPITFTEGPNRRTLGFEPGSGESVLDHVLIDDGGGEWCCGNSEPAITIRQASPTITNSTISDSHYHAIAVSEGGAPEIGDNEILDANGKGITYSAGAEESGEINIYGNLIEGGWSGITIAASEASINGKSLGGNTIVGATGNGLSFSGPDIPADVTTNTLSENGTNLIDIAGTVTQSATWTTGNKVEPNEVTIANGATVTVKPGVQFTSARMVVNGTIIADGTEEAPITFTEGPNRRTLGFEPGSGESVLDHVLIDDGGGEWCCGNSEPAITIRQASPTITNSTISDSHHYAIDVTQGGGPEIGNNQILNPNGRAINYNAGSGHTGEINIYDNLIEGGWSGITITAGSSTVSGESLGGNTIIGTTGNGLSYSGPDIPNNATGNTLSENKDNIIHLSGTVAQSSTWHSGGNIVEPDNVTIAAGATLTMDPDLYLVGARMTVKGTLDADATAVEPIIFTNGQRRTTLAFEPGSSASVVDHVVVEEGGGEWCCGNSEPAITIRQASPTITNTTISDSDYHGIGVSEGAGPTISNNEISNSNGSAISVTQGGSPEISSNALLESKSTALAYGASSGHSGEINIHDNFILGGSNGITMFVGNSSVTAKLLSENTVIGTDGIGLNYSGPDIPGGITDNTLTGNKNNIIKISGTVAHSSTWNDADVKVEANSVTVAAGATLNITEGIYFVKPRFTVKGTLHAEGTSAEPIIFAEGPNRATFTFEASSGASVVDYVEIDGGGGSWCCGNSEAAIRVKKVSPTITNSTIRNSKYYAIAVTESGAPKVEWNRFRNNTSGGLSYSGTGDLSAPNNDWGCANGPSPAGCGDSVSSTVKWKPAAQLPELEGHCFGKDSQCGEGADPVSLATGHLSYSHRDLILTNESDTPLEFTRAYNSGNGTDTGLGPGWSQTGLASAMELASGEVLVLRQDGRQDIFYDTESGYKAPSGVTDVLTKVEGGFELTSLDGTVHRFDESGRIAWIIDDHGLKTTYGYNESGRLTTITDPSAQTLTFSYNGSNHITKVTDSTGREVKYTYTGAGDLKTVTDALGGVTEYSYDSEHRITSIKDPRENVILQNAYDGQGRVVEQLDGLENLWELEYKEGETVVTEPEGGDIVYGFDGQDRVVSETDQLGKTTATSYNAAGLVDEVVKPGGAKWTYDYDTVGNLTSVVDPEEGERSYEYDGQNRLIGFTDARSNSWGYEWSEAGDLVKITDPEEGETTLTYNETGLPSSVTDPNEHKTEFGYDGRGNVLSVTDPLEHETSFEYDARNNLVEKTLPGALKAEVLGRNALGELTSRTTPEGHTTSYVYNATGMPTEITDPAENVWKIAYNAMGRPTTYTDPAEQQAAVAYDGNLKPSKITDRRGKETTFAYDLANRLTKVTRPESGIWSYGYDARGNRTSVVDPRENETTYEFDLLDRMTKAEEPLEVSSEYGYDAEGNLTSVVDPRGNTTNYEYDKLGRPTAIDQPLEKTTSLSYDGVGNLLSRSTAVGTLEYEYDAADRLQEVSSGETTLRSFGYDEADRLTAATDAQGKEIEIGYDEDDKVTSIDDGRGQSLTRSYNSRGYLTEQVDGRGTLEYEYDKLGRLTSLTNPQSKESTFAYNAEGGLTEVKRPGGIDTTNVYDNAGRMAETTTEAAGEPPTVLEALEYSYDAAGNVVKRIDARLEQETSYAYNALNRLTEFNPPGEGATSYGYDAAGNRTSAPGTTYSFNALNQLTEASDGTTYGYDGAGRLTSIAKGEEETTFEWDLFDHLATVESPSESASYAYDALERLSERTTGSGTTATHYGDLSDLPTYDANGEGETTTSYVRGAEGLLEQRSGEATTFPLSDAHGDVTAVANAAGEVASRQSYDPWGAQVSGPILEMGYLGTQQRRFDPTSGLIQMGARSYSPTLGQFMTEDPVLGHLGVGTSFDRYAYAWDNPLNFYDLDGRDVCVPTPFGDACAGEAAEDVGNAAGNVGHTAGSAAENAWNWTQPGRQWVGDRAQDLWKATGDYVTSCLGNAAWGAVSGAALGAAAGGAGAVPGAIGGGLSGCGAGLVQQGLEDSGQDTAAEVVNVGTAAKDVGKAAKGLGKEAPELPERIKDVWDVFF